MGSMRGSAPQHLGGDGPAQHQEINSQMNFQAATPLQG